MQWDPGLLSSFLATLVGGVTALAGVAITQRSARKNAHADRIWSQRMQAYGALYEVLEADLRALRSCDGGKVLDGCRQVLDKPLPADATQQLYLFASRSVIDGYREYYRALASLLTAPEEGDHIPGLVSIAKAKGDKLQLLITHETRGD